MAPRKSKARKTMTGRKKSTRKATTRKTATRKTTTRKSTTRKYSTAVGREVQEEMHEMKRGRLHSGRSGKVVTDPKQAIAIALDEARRKGKRVPPNPNEKE
jgi:ribosomal protein L21E